MSVLVWNCQGIGQDLTVRSLRQLSRKNRPSLIFLMETKKSESYVDDLRRSMRFPAGEVVNPQGLSGGLALWWTEDVDVQILGKCRHYFDTKITEVSSNKSWRATFIYGEPKREWREDFWHDMQRLISGSNEPWLCIGDLNAMLSQQDKNGGAQVHQVDAFHNFVDLGRLLDLGYHGQNFTWTNRRIGGDNVKGRIDRALANVEWREIYPRAQLFHENLIGSDHRPIVLKLVVWSRRRKKSFKFESRWTEEGDCENLIRSNWGIEGDACDLGHFSKKLVDCSAALSSWNAANIGNSRNAIEKIKDRIERINERPLTEELKKEENELQKQLNGLLKQEEMYWQQRSRIAWLNHGDQNTRFFHVSTIQRRQRNQLLKLKDSQGRWHDGERAITDMVLDFFQHLYKSEAQPIPDEFLDCVPRCVSQEMNDGLVALVSDNEIKEAVFGLGALKAPGPDGFSGLFYQKYWRVVGRDVTAAVQQFFRSGIMPKETNSTDIVLVPKVARPECITQYRPISLCNFIYKVISKVMVNRLKQWMDGIISQNQAAFVPGRSIQDNILIAHEAYHGLRLKNSGKQYSMAMKLDMQKAYDRVEWHFLEAVMVTMGFCQTWIEWIMQCVKSVSYRIMVNGSPSSEFFPSRGLRQGDPLSPYLFIIVSDVLSHVLSFYLNHGGLQGYRIKRTCPSLSHIMFADDTLLFGRASMEEVSLFLNVLNAYTTYSGQAINFHKCSITFSSNTPPSVRKDTVAILGMKEADPEERYLGLPASWGHSKIKAMSFLKDRILAKVQAWKQSLLSQSGREVLIKAVLTAIPTYCMSCFLMPKGLVEEANKIIRRFWWGSYDEQRKVHWIRWTDLTKPKTAGGMGFRDLRLFNQALLGKQAWRLMHRPHDLWARIIKGIYYPNSDFLNASKGGYASWAWNSILVGKEILQRGLRWNIGNGAQTSIWQDAWVPQLENFKIQSQRPPNCADCMVADLLIPNTHIWDMSKLRSYFTSEEMRAIQRIQVSYLAAHDKLIWHFDKKGVYSVKSAYGLLSAPMNVNSNRPSTSSGFSSSWRSVWKLHAPAKIRNFIWRAIRNAIPCQVSCCKRGIVSVTTCQVCGLEDESVEHLLFFCEHATASWFASGLGYVPAKEGFRSFDIWWKGINELASQTNSSRLPSLAAHVCWQIWKSRNAFVNDYKPIIPINTANKAMNCAAQFADATHCFQAKIHPPSFVSPTTHHWIPPDANHIKINCDASLGQVDLCAGLGVVCRNAAGQIVQGYGSTRPVQSILQAEALALREAISLASSFGVSRVSIESDAASLVQAIKDSNGPPDWEIFPIVSDIKCRLAALSNVSVSYISRSANRVADWVARTVRTRSLPLDWVVNPPDCLSQLLVSDFPVQ